MTSKIVLILNIKNKIYQQFKTSHFDHLTKILPNIHLLPTITIDQDNIHTRSQKIEENYSNFSEKNIKKGDNVHLVSYGIAGLDTRLYLSYMANNFKSLTTLGTPHKGCLLADGILNGKFQKVPVEPLYRLLGVSHNSFLEINSENLQAYNLEVPNVQQIKYFSIGGLINYANSSEIFKKSNLYLYENQQSIVPIDNDGVFCGNEVKWGNHLHNFDIDHAGLVGIGNNINARLQAERIFNLIQKNISLNV